jgi:hypothetical protein
VAAIFFAVNLLYLFTRHAAMDAGLVKSTAVLVLFTGIYITTTDKKYLIGSIPLRIILFSASILGLVAFFISDPHR